jgi:transcriptional regulator with XRE-family HTH domain
MSANAAEWFAGRLRELREAAGWTQSELAERAGLTRDGVAHLEQGRRKPGWETVLALAEALGVDCLAFTLRPAGESPAGRGRPRKGTSAPPAPAGCRGKPEGKGGGRKGKPAAGQEG